MININDSFATSSQPLSPLEVARRSAQETLRLAADNNNVVLAMGEHHHIFSHQASETLALIELAKRNQQVTLFMEYPHNRLYTILLDKGYTADNASLLAKHITNDDTDGHITAKAIIGGNPNSLRGADFHRFESHLPIKAAIHHNIKIVYADSARIYPEDFCIDYSDASTETIATQIDARRGLEGKMGPDDMLIRNTHMAQTIKKELETNGGVGILPTGAAHTLGIDDKENGNHLYKDSLAQQFETIGLSAVIARMTPYETLPNDYEKPTGEQKHLFYKPQPSTLVDNMSSDDINTFLRTNGLDPNIYNPKNFIEDYRSEFNAVLAQAETELNITRPILQEQKSRAAPCSSEPSQKTNKPTSP